jgi:hypothetical protein
MSPKQPRRSRRKAEPAGAASPAPRQARSPAFQPHAHPRSDDGTAFMPDPGDGPAHIRDDLAESLAEEFIQSATRGNDADDEKLDGVVPEEIGGPFVETSAAEEFANDTDEMNPPDAEREPLPRPVAGLIALPDEDLEGDEHGEGPGGQRRHDDG